MVEQNASPLDLGILLGLAYQTFTDELKASLHAQGFTDLGGVYGYVFRALDTEALHLRTLAQRLGMTDQGASKIIDEMERRGYVERRPDPSDGRAKELRLAARGRAALSAARKFHAAYERRFSAKLGEPEIRNLRHALVAMVSAGGTDAAHARLRAL